MRETHLVKPRAVDHGVTVPRVRRRGALLPGRGPRGAPALLLDPRRAVRVDLAAHAVGTAHRQVGVRTLKQKRQIRGERSVHHVLEVEMQVAGRPHVAITYSQSTATNQSTTCTTRDAAARARSLARGHIDSSFIPIPPPSPPRPSEAPPAFATAPEWRQRDMHGHQESEDYKMRKQSECNNVKYYWTHTLRGRVASINGVENLTC